MEAKTGDDGFHLDRMQLGLLPPPAGRVCFPLTGMAVMREVNGFTLEPAPEYLNLDQPGWMPQIRVRRGANFDELYHQGVETLFETEAAAMEFTTTWINAITHVGYTGELRLER